MTKTLRGYVLAFCLYLGYAVQWVSRWNTPIRTPHLDRTIFAFYTRVIVPLFLVFMFFSLLRAFEKPIDKVVLTLSGLYFALTAVFALHQFEYIVFTIPNALSGWIFLLTTLLLGYRTNALLKKHDVEIEA